jgi:lipopolysaccharide/colanic/teichoic acid biosynthesis glycosyltransferase
MVMFKRKNKISRRKLKSFVDVKNGWYASKDFSALMVRETKRSYRTGLPLSLITLDLSYINHEKDNYISLQYPQFFKDLIQLITENTRDIDLKCLNNKYEINILLADTEISGAKILTEKISGALYQRLNSANEKNITKIVKYIKISTYPLNRISGTARIEATPVVINNLEFSKDEHNQSEEIFLQKISNLYIDWDIMPSSTGTISISYPAYNRFPFDDVFHLGYKILKRLLDIIGSVIGILLFLPAMIIIAIAIKISSTGPVFFKQERLTQYGRKFSFRKFRTMNSNCDDQIHREYVKKLIEGEDDSTNYGTIENPLYKIKNDPRITKVGQILRRTSLDELPQFFNVLIGDMSLVGPRPPIPYELDTYKNWHYRRILEIKPGITGLWQIQGRSTTTFDQMVRLDLQYAKNQSLLVDIKIMLKTIRAFFKSYGAF